MKQSIGVDIGGTKVAVAIINEKGEIVSRRQAPSEVESAETLFEQVVRLINEELNEHPFSIQEMEGIGIGLPGKVDVENGVAVFQNNIPWPNFPIVKRLQEVYGNIPVKIDNDVKVAAYAEYRLQNLQKKKCLRMSLYQLELQQPILFIMKFFEVQDSQVKLDLFQFISLVNG